MKKIMFLVMLLATVLSTCSSSEDSIEVPSLDEVETWFYYLGFDPDEETLSLIEESSYDMVVMEPIFNEENNTDFPVAELVERYHSAETPKLVIAYIDIGQAEEWRTYWQDGWEVGDPEWIVAEDPDGWTGNYPVAYWHDEWREIWLGEDGYLQQLLDNGFDGIYLDWVEAYSDEAVMDAAEADGVDPEEEMVWFVEDMAAFTRAEDPDFIIIGQNAAELAANDDYAAVIDAIAQEQTWFDGAADNDPPGDCPLPATDDDIETQEYMDSLSSECLELHDDYPESTLHMSSEEYIDDLLTAQDQGLVIFTVDYALEEENVDFIYETSRSYGFIPFAGERALATFLDPVE